MELVGCTQGHEHVQTLPGTAACLGSQVYHGLKEAISCLSPIIRNRLRGLPAYVLDYSDLIAPNR